MAKLEWVRIPTNWIRFNEILPKFSQRNLGQSTSALILYITLCLFKNDETTDAFDEIGYVRMTYTEIEILTGLSRSLISRGLKFLVSNNLITISRVGVCNLYHISDYTKKSGWGKLPKAHLLNGSKKNGIRIFHLFKLKNVTELNALKIYLLIIAEIRNETNSAQMSYSKIVKITGVGKNSIRKALSFLINLSLIQIDNPHIIDDLSAFPVNSTVFERDSIGSTQSNIYRVSGITLWRRSSTQKRAERNSNPFGKSERNHEITDIF